MASWQQVLALDAKFNNFRAPNDPAFKRLYLRRRNHLLRTSSQFKSDVFTATSVTSIPELNLSGCKGSISSSSTTNLSCSNTNSYLQIRTHLLQQKYKVCLDQLSHRSSRPPSRVTLIAGDNGGTGQLSTAFRSAIASSGFGSGPGYSGSSSRGYASQCASGVVPTNRARASLAIVGGTTLGENYAFSGVHHIFDQHKGVITMVKFGHNDSSLFCCSSLDGTVTVCNAGEEATILHTLTAHQSPVMGVDWSSSNDLLASCSCDGTVCVWCADTGTCLRMRPPAMPGQTALVVLFHPLNSNWLVVGGSDGNVCGRVQVLGLSTGRVVQGGTASTPAPVTALAFDDQGTMLWAGDDKGSISSFHVKVSSGGLRAGRRTLLSPPGAAVTHLEHRTWASREARDPSLLVSAACDALLLFSVVDGDGGLSQRCRLPVPHQHHRSLRATFPPLMSFREGAAVVSGSEDGSVLFLDIEKPQRPLINKLQGHAAAVLSPAFNYTESLLATGDAAGIVIVWKRQHEAE